MPLPPEVRARAHALRRDIHRHPELSHHERRTQAQVETALAEIGLLPVRAGGTGLYVDVGQGERMVAVRVDLDALPIEEQTGAPFASVIPGVMHACGHDLHAAAGYAVAATLARETLPGRVRVLFQPAEEKGEGARKLLADGALDGVAAVLGGHVDLDYPVGTVALQAGPICASTDQFTMTVWGRTGHGARPHQGTDALVAAAQVVVALQSVVAREIEPGQPAVLTIGTFHAGERANILAGSAVLEGTLRAHDPAVRARLRESLRRVLIGVAAATGTEADLDLRPGHDPIVNDPALTEVVAAGLREVPLQLVRLARPNTGGEDFSELHRDRPGVYVRWGGSGPGSRSDPAHSPGFLPDDGVLDAAALGFAAAARRTLRA